MSSVLQGEVERVAWAVRYPRRFVSEQVGGGSTGTLACAYGWLAGPRAEAEVPVLRLARHARAQA